MRITRLTRKEVDITIVARLKNGAVFIPAGVQVALMTPKVVPNSATVWTTASYESNIATFIVAGPDASPTGALVVPVGGADLWIKVVEASEVDAVKVERITLIS